MDVLLLIISAIIGIVVSAYQWLDMFLAKPITVFAASLLIFVMLRISYGIHAVHDKTLNAMKKEADLNAAEQRELLLTCGRMLASIQHDLEYRFDDNTRTNRRSDDG